MVYNLWAGQKPSFVEIFGRSTCRCRRTLSFSRNAKSCRHHHLRGENLERSGHRVGAANRSSTPDLSKEVSRARSRRGGRAHESSLRTRLVVLARSLARRVLGRVSGNLAHPQISGFGVFNMSSHVVQDFREF